MKKMLILILTLSVLMLLSITASAHGWHDNDHKWHRTHPNDAESERGLPFKWHEHYDFMREQHRMERIYDREWDHRFPGLQAYRWSSDEGFWHHGHYVKNAVLFFDRNHELVSVGYMSDDVFIHFVEDHESYESHDSFFLSWSHRSGW